MYCNIYCTRVWKFGVSKNQLNYIYIYIYAFSRRFYPKRLTIAFRLYIFISTCVPWESNPQHFAQQTQCSTAEPHRNTCQYGSIKLNKSDSKDIYMFNKYSISINHVIKKNKTDIIIVSTKNIKQYSF